jgi:hypothetical protein
VSEPPAAGRDRWDGEGLATLGLGLPELRPGPPALALLTQRTGCPDRYPRKAGIPAKRPLW